MIDTHSMGPHNPDDAIPSGHGGGGDQGGVSDPGAGGCEVTNDELERPAMSDLVRFDVGISGGLITSAEGKWVSYASHCASRDALVNVVDAQANEIERLRQRLAEHELDAIRYKWLRTHARRIDVSGFCISADYDARIDAAMEREP